MALDQILKLKRLEVLKAKRLLPLTKLKNQATRVKRPPISLYAKLKNSDDKPHLICEIKKASPSQGIIRKNFNPESIAKEFNRAGASAISVLTDKPFFQGSVEILKKVRRATKLPILRKDFLIDEYQVYESRLIGADCILLIVAALTKRELKQLLTLANKLNLESLVEVHSKKELKIALQAGSKIIGINNRNLKTLKVDVNYAQTVIDQIPNSIARIVESGVDSPRDIQRYNRNKVDAFLVGTSLMKSKNISKKIRQFKNAYDSR